jgi:hypothetical protein
MNRAYAAAKVSRACTQRAFRTEAAPVHSAGRSNQATQRLLLAGIQARLAVSEPGDALEREADDVADRVLRMHDVATPAHVADGSAAQLKRKCATCEGEQRATKGMCAACEAQALALQRKPDGKMSSAPQAVVRGAGAALPQPVRAFFEPRLDRDLSHVRVHTDARAAGSAQSLHALAYTSGRDIVFGAGRYAPGTETGRRLLAHELAHVVQQESRPEARSRLHRQPEGEDLPDAPPEVEPLPPFEPPGPEPQVECKIDIFKRELECCAPAPGVGRVCAPDPFTVKRKIEEALARMRRKKPRAPPAGIDACPDARRIPSDAPPPFRSGGCCPEGTLWFNDRCRTIPITPSCTPEQCSEDEVFIGLPGRCCIPRIVEPPPPPPPPPPGERVATSHEVFFQLDRPRPGEPSRAAFESGVTGEGKASFATLVAALKAEPALKVQLIGGASPEGDDAYNFDLATRRARAVAAALEREGIGAGRIADPPENDLRSECREVGTGLRSCGEAGATGARDRRVLARVFDPR